MWKWIGGISALLLVGLVVVRWWNGRVPSRASASPAQLAPCPPSPNCVCSEADKADAEHAIDAITIGDASDDAWQQLQRIVERMPRTRRVAGTDDYVHFEVRSWLMGYIDDLELRRNRSEGQVEVRSASRVGYSDLGVNRSRVEAIRQAFQATRATASSAARRGE